MNEWTVSKAVYSMINAIYRWRALAVLGIVRQTRAPYDRSAVLYSTFPVQHRMQTPILLVWLDGLKYNTFHRQELSVSVCLFLSYHKKIWGKAASHRAGLFGSLSQRETFQSYLCNTSKCACEVDGDEVVSLIDELSDRK